MKKEEITERSSIDDIVELYKRDVDRTLLRENLKLTVEQRFEQLMNMQRFVERERRAGRVYRDFEVLIAMKASRSENR